MDTYVSTGSKEVIHHNFYTFFIIHFYKGLKVLLKQSWMHDILPGQNFERLRLLHNNGTWACDHQSVNEGLILQKERPTIGELNQKLIAFFPKVLNLSRWRVPLVQVLQELLAKSLNIIRLQDFQAIQHFIMRHSPKLLSHQSTQRWESMLHLGFISKDILVTLKKLEELIQNHLPVYSIVRFNVFV